MKQVNGSRTGNIYHLKCWKSFPCAAPKAAESEITPSRRDDITHLSKGGSCKPQRLTLLCHLRVFYLLVFVLPPLSSHIPMENTINISVSHRGIAHPLSLLPDSTLDLLHQRLEELTSVAPENPKLLYKGKKAVPNDATVTEAGLKDGTKVQLIGPTADELGGLKATESEHQRKERILQERAQRGTVKVRRAASVGDLPVSALPGCGCLGLGVPGLLACCTGYCNNRIVCGCGALLGCRSEMNPSQESGQTPGS